MSAAHEAMLAKLAELARAVEDAQAYEHDRGLASHRSRRHAGDTLRCLRHWREHVTDAERSATVKRVVADGTVATRAASADKQVNVVCTKEPPKCQPHHP
jgi:hypothetical protein